LIHFYKRYQLKNLADLSIPGVTQDYN